MSIANDDIRRTAKANGVPHWRIAEMLGMSESLFCRKLRHEMSADEKSKILDIIDQVKNEGVVNG